MQDFHKAMEDILKCLVAVSYTHLAASKREKTIDFQIVGMKSNKKKKKTVIINKRRDRKPKQKFKRKRR